MQFFVDIWEFITRQLEALKTLDGFVREIIINLPQYLSWLPDGIYALVISGIGFAVFYLIVGR